MEMNVQQPASPIRVVPYSLAQWIPLWQLRFHQLAEAGIILPPTEMPAQPLDVGQDDAEWDYHHLAAVYLSGAGGFWLAWWGDEPAGHIAGQDIGGAIELRRMYVRAAFRRRGIAAGLVQALLAHCQAQSVRAVELWTESEGLGQRLYARMGFKVAARPGEEFAACAAQTHFIPGATEIRMRIELF